MKNHRLKLAEQSSFSVIDSYCKRHCKTGDVFFVNGTVFADGEFVRRNLRLSNNRLYLCDSHEDGAVIDCEGMHILPGLADVHVHLRQPGFEHKETIKTGTRAALAGGYTFVCSMPNLSPVPDTAENISIQTEKIKKEAHCKVVPYASITLGQKGEELVDFQSLAPYCFAFTDDGKGVQSDEHMLQAMLEARSVNRPIASHCEVDSLVKGGVIHDGEYARRNSLPPISAKSEYEMLARDISLAAVTGVHYHVCHVSCASSVKLIRGAKSAGVHITAETAPHYLVLTDEDLKDEGRFKMNPPIRSSVDRAELIDGIIDGTIDMIATDHAPHSAEEKSGGLLNSAFGIVGLETAFAIMYTNFVKTDVFSFKRLVELMSIRPREAFGLKAGIYNGAYADFCIVDTKSKYNIDPSTFFSKGRATPFEGMEVYGKVMFTRCAFPKSYQ